MKTAMCDPPPRHVHDAVAPRHGQQLAHASPWRTSVALSGQSTRDEVEEHVLVVGDVDSVLVEPTAARHHLAPTVRALLDITAVVMHSAALV